MEGFNYVHPVEVAFRDLDGMAHVNNVVYLTYMESARMAWWMKVTGARDIKGITMILARTEIDYRRPVGFPARLLVGARCASMRRSSFVLEFRVEHEGGDGAALAEARKVLVHFDYATNRAVPLTPELKARIRAQDPEVREEA